MTRPDRFHLSRGGVLNVWQYDEQVFDFAGGRLLLRGANGAGKSKTMEMLLPFVIDGDKTRMTASGRHHTSLLWLMLDGYDGGGRTGYLWVEFTRRGDDGRPVTVTCGVGIRATQSARAATAWFFTSPRQVGVDLFLEDESGPLSQQRLKAEVEVDGHFFDSPRRYRDHVGELLFGLAPDQYDELLRLLYWLRQPQVGEDIEPRRLAEQLVQALPQVDGTAVRTAGDTFDELEAFGEQIDRRAAAASAMADFVATYAGYARSVLAQRGTAVLDADAEVRRRRSQLRRTERALSDADEALAGRRSERADVAAQEATAAARITALENGPEARARQRLLEMGKRVFVLEARVEQAATLAEEARVRAAESALRAQRDGDSLAGDARRLHEEASGTADEVSRAGAAAGFPTTRALAEPELDWRQSPEHAAAVDAAAVGLATWIGQVRGPLGELRAAVQVVEQARQDAQAARERAAGIDAEAARVEARVEGEQEQARQAAARSRSLEAALAESLAGWQASDDAVVFELPELTAGGLAGLEGAAREATAGRRADLEETVSQALAALRAGEARRRTLTQQRQHIVAEVDPPPLPPPWHRDHRSGRAGAALWRLVDFHDEVPAAARAGLEAALEGSGLLDAWVTPDGRVEGSTPDDVLLVDEECPSGQRSVDGSLACVLRPDVPSGCPVPEELVTALLTRVRLGGAEPVQPEPVQPALGTLEAAGAAIRVALDGQWRSGPMAGRTSKPAAQFIGATARAAERERRLAVVDEQLREVEAEIDRATIARTGATQARERLDAWLGSRPRHEPVLRAWAAEEERQAVAEAGVRELQEVTSRASAARAEAAARHTELERLAHLHSLPSTAAGLQARSERLRTIASALDAHERTVRDIRRRVEAWESDAARATADGVAHAARTAEVSSARADWERLRNERDELAAADGASVAELEERLRSLGQERRTAEQRVAELDQELEELIREVGRLGNGFETDRELLAAAEPALDVARDALATLERVPGLVTAAGLTPAALLAGPSPLGPSALGPSALDPSAVEGAEGGEPVDETRAGSILEGADLATVRRVVELTSSARHSDVNAVLQALSSLQSGPAALNEPRMLDIGGVLAAIGRDDSGELPMVRLAHRLATSVAADRELLSERERTLFENHVLGHLGDALRGVRLKADELVQAMNDQLHDVTTSQGIRVRLRWRLRDDIPAEARRAVQLLGEPLGALLPGERAELRDSLHRLIDVSRAEAPEQTYAEHLARALDYRQWYAFTVQYHRPETGEWRDLHRKTALSQGEQKVLCYLPLFAAAAAHFASVAGAAPHAPRFVLLDDAFPKIDVRTHPLLFGLLVDLDLDFVVTSERLWGTHATVPELAIYEALRSPTERGIAQYEHRWDGHQLTAVGS